MTEGWDQVQFSLHRDKMKNSANSTTACFEIEALYKRGCVDYKMYRIIFSR